jgi:hypothetical protein
MITTHHFEIYSGEAGISPEIKGQRLWLYIAQPQLLDPGFTCDIPFFTVAKYLLNILGNPKLLPSPTGEEVQFGETYPKLLRGYLAKDVSR